MSVQRLVLVPFLALLAVAAVLAAIASVGIPWLGAGIRQADSEVVSAWYGPEALPTKAAEAGFVSSAAEGRFLETGARDAMGWLAAVALVTASWIALRLTSFSRTGPGAWANVAAASALLFAASMLASASGRFLGYSVGRATEAATLATSAAPGVAWTVTVPAIALFAVGIGGLVLAARAGYVECERVLEVKA